MYNEEMKTRFIKETAKTDYTIRSYESIFNTFEPYEVAWGDDLCTRTAEELTPIVEKIVGIRTRSKALRISMLKNYVKWCIDHGYPNAINGISEIDRLGLDKIKNMTVANPLHLQACMDLVFEKEDEQTVDNIYRAYLWMAYGGMPQAEAVNVLKTEVHFETMEIIHGDYDIPIYREGLKAISNCVNLKQFAFKHPRYVSRIFKQRAPDKELLTGLQSRPDVNILKVELSSRFKKSTDAGSTKMRLSYKRVWLSGLFYRVKTIEDAGFPPDFSFAADEMMKGKEYDFRKSGLTMERKRNIIINDYMVDYLRWKEAYFG